MFNEYYQEELSFFREMGREFAGAHPTTAHFLANPGSDPDVERLLEGVAFLTGRIRQKLDDEFPELAHSMMSLLCPHYLRPLPAMTVVQFEPVVEALRSRAVISTGTMIDSVPVEGIQCRFRTTSNVTLYPLVLSDVILDTPSKSAPCLKLTFSNPSGLNLAKMGLSDLRLYVRGEDQEGYELYFWLSHLVKRWMIRSLGRGKSDSVINMPLDNIRPAGFDDHEALLPYPSNSFPGYRLLQEYFSLPEKFLMIDLTGLDRTAALDCDGDLEMIFELSRLPETDYRLSAENILLYCAPAVNLFSHEADPIRVNQERFEYPIRPTGANPDRFEIYGIDRVTGYLPGTAEEMIYQPFFSFRHSSEETKSDLIYYHPRMRESVSDQSTTTSISFINVRQQRLIPPTEIISLELTCTNGRLPEKLRTGDLKVMTSDTTGLARFRNVSRISRAVPPPLSRNVHWLLMSHWSLNYLSLANVESLRNVLSLYNFQAFVDRQAAQRSELLLSGLVKARGKPEERFYLGRPIQGVGIELELKEDNFFSEGNLYLFGRILHEFMTTYATMNSFTRLTITGAERREQYRWPARIGRQLLL
jgi:type VI secretion system protein ImpG